ncbi:MAG TPA: sugar phosphate isomerase/epimerase [Baekduia sp.]|uniref:sugar phosphate isomerase/epimerase family protein n=1 Tax=Baekduia sp. TaxID=2600305 RepID=UPI002D79B13B|nr:sugar phosphate isomerase/epimerase [Baekduia sp.]HET6510006.1 sugar phosphate isomerase/epimerase [Baekduia sp.]
MSTARQLAGAPITWGVCEVPGWGTMLPPDRVSAEMASLGLTATELGPVDDYLPLDAAAIRGALDPHGLRLLGGFVPLVLHVESERDAAVAQARRVASAMADAGASTFVLAIVQDADWSAPQPLDDAGWATLAAGVDAVAAATAQLGLTTVVHPHQGTLIERRAEVDRLAELSTVAWCLDPGHLALGGYDPIEFVDAWGDRVAHVHLKDVDLKVAERLNAGELTLMAAVQEGLFVPLGAGDGRIAELVAALDARGYDGWMVLEQDCAITGAVPEPGAGPVLDAQASLRFLETVPAGAR